MTTGLGDSRGLLQSSCAATITDGALYMHLGADADCRDTSILLRAVSPPAHPYPAEPRLASIEVV